MYDVFQMILWKDVKTNGRGKQGIALTLVIVESLSEIKKKKKIMSLMMGNIKISF